MKWHLDWEGLLCIGLGLQIIGLGLQIIGGILILIGEGFRLL